MDTPQRLLGQLTDLATPYAVRVVATLRIADHIAVGTSTVDGLAAATGSDPDTLARLLRYLVHRGVFTEATPGWFGLTEVGELLCESGPAGQRAWLDDLGLGARMDRAYTGLLYSVHSGGAAYPALFGRTLWEDLDEHPDWRAYFDALMRSQQEITAPQVAALYPWSGVARVMDVGGGSGALLVELLRVYPHLRGILLDRPGSVAATAARLARLDIADRLEVAGGDFFADLPPGADVYVVSRALSDWNDTDATTILRRCAAAAGPHGRVLVVEVLPVEPHQPYQTSFDLQMLATVGGRERTLAEFTALFGAAGLAVGQIYRGRDGLVLLDAGGLDAGTPDAGGRDLGDPAG